MPRCPSAIDADAEPEPPGGLPKGGVTRVALPNRHLEYALTWYGLALTLIGVYLAFAISRLRASVRARHQDGNSRFPAYACRSGRLVRPLLAS